MTYRTYTIHDLASDRRFDSEAGKPVMYLCPKCGKEIDCLAGYSTHYINWYCSDEEGCGWKAWVLEYEPKQDTQPELSERVLSVRDEWLVRETLYAIAGYSAPAISAAYDKFKHQLAQEAPPAQPDKTAARVAELERACATYISRLEHTWGRLNATDFDLYISYGWADSEGNAIPVEAKRPMGEGESDGN